MAKKKTTIKNSPVRIYPAYHRSAFSQIRKLEERLQLIRQSIDVLFPNFLTD